ncbi:MAG: exo-alpha-sialidase [Frankiaceae bacterium]|nr:exo-alpha-sialidase [Frankiaceae bacterium]
MKRRPIVLAVSGAVLAAVALGGAPSSGAAETGIAFRSYQAPTGLGDKAGEPTLGINPKTGAVVFQAYTETLRVTEFDKAGPGKAKWELGNYPLPQPRSFDPILRTDEMTGRTFTSQLLLACSQAAFTDDDGRTFTPSSGCGPGTLFDHQSVGFGPYVEGSQLPKSPVADYPNVVYYCAQDVGTAKCAMSTDGGLTFPVSGVAYTTAECQLGGIFGHIKSDPHDGTVYLPPRYCPDLSAEEYQTGVSVSTDNGLTWEIREVPGSVYGDAGHPSVGIGRKDGYVYMGWGGPLDGKTVFQSGPPMASVSRDKGKTWTKPMALGQDVGIKNTRFPVAVAGDPGRAAIGFLGSKTGGDGSATTFPGRWDLYVAFSNDFGKTWTTVNATPEHPVQVGNVCTAGTTCAAGTRNLLDFNDMVIDQKTGYVAAAIADGCPGTAVCSTAVRAQKATVVRQVSGMSLYGRPVAGQPVRPPAAAPAPAAAPPSGGGSTLPTTGMTAPVAGLGVLLLVLAAVLTGATRRRHA